MESVLTDLITWFMHQTKQSKCQKNAQWLKKDVGGGRREGIEGIDEYFMNSSPFNLTSAKESSAAV